MSTRSVGKRLEDLEAAANLAEQPRYYTHEVFGRLEVGRPLALVWDVDILDATTRAKREGVDHGEDL